MTAMMVKEMMSVDGCCNGVAIFGIGFETK